MGGGRRELPLRSLVARDGELTIEERPTPDPEGDRLLVEIDGAGLNRADLLQVLGGYPAPAGWPEDVPGLEFSGKVVATGRHVRSFDIGDSVFGIAGGGAHSTHLVVPEPLCARRPKAVDPIEAGGIPEVFVTVHDALITQAGLTAGETVLIHGAGSGVGTAAVQLASAVGATTIGTARTPEKLERAKELGLDRAVVASDSMAEEIGEVDVVLDLLGGDYIGLDLEVCRTRGRIVLVGLIAGSTVDLDLGTLLRKRLVLRGTVLRTRSGHEKAAAVAAFASHVVPLLERGELKPIIDSIVPLDRAREAYERMSSNANFGKIVLDMRS